MRPLPLSRIDRLNLGDHTEVTILALGRGINTNGTLSPEGEARVERTLNVARAIKSRGYKVRIVWTGGKSLAQVKQHIVIGGAGSEGAAMLVSAKNQLTPDDDFEQYEETVSTSTVGNMARSTHLVKPDSLVVVVTDVLHCKYGRVWHAARLALPLHDIRIVSMQSPYGRKQLVNQLLSAIVTAIGMLGVKRGDASAILKRQARLEDVLRRR